jgi:hypothetical protein
VGARFEWQVRHDEPIDPALAPRPPEAEKRRRFRLSGPLVLLYLGAVAAAGWFGFNLGRWSIASGQELRLLTNQLAIEELAWQEGDLELFASTLHPRAPEGWRDELVGNFRRHSQVPYEVELEGRQPAEGGGLDVQVRVTVPEGSFVELRRYEAASGALLRMPGLGGGVD